MWEIQTFFPNLENEFRKHRRFIPNLENNFGNKDRFSKFGKQFWKHGRFSKFGNSNFGNNGVLPHLENNFGFFGNPNLEKSYLENHFWK